MSSCESVIVVTFVVWICGELYGGLWRFAHEEYSHDGNQLPPVIEARAHQELIALFQRSSEEIAVVKRLQWNGVYYAIAIDVALVGARTQFNSASLAWMSQVLVVAAVVTGALTMFFLRRCATDLEKYRERIVRISKMFSEPFRNAWGTPSPREEKRRFVRMFYVVIVSATVVTALLICTIGG